jgi:hypothetical protein
MVLIAALAFIAIFFFLVLQTNLWMRISEWEGWVFLRNGRQKK